MGMALSVQLYHRNHIRQIVSGSQTAYKYNQAIHLTKIMFYFVYPHSDTLAPYPWILPYPQIQQIPQINENIPSYNSARQSIVETIILSRTPCDSTASVQTIIRPQSPKNSFSLRKKQGDDDYKPIGPSNKKMRKPQMQNRNVVPNVVRLVLSYIQKKEKSQSKVELLLKKYNNVSSSIGVKRYYLFQKMVRSKMDNYVNEETLKQLYCTRPQEFEVYPEKEQLIYNQITRTIIMAFVHGDILPCILTSKRMERSKKQAHISAIRTVKQKLLNVLRN